jgi:hypothetical protein
MSKIEPDQNGGLSHKHHHQHRQNHRHRHEHQHKRHGHGALKGQQQQELQLPPPLPKTVKSDAPTDGDDAEEGEIELQPETLPVPHRLRDCYSIVLRDIALKGLNKWQIPKLKLQLFRDEETALTNAREASAVESSDQSGSAAFEESTSEWREVARAGSVAAAALLPVRAVPKKPIPVTDGPIASLWSQEPTESNEAMHHWCLTSQSDPSHRHMRASTLEDPTDALPALVFKDWSRFTASSTLNVSVVESPTAINTPPTKSTPASSTASGKGAKGATAVKANERKAQRDKLLFSVLLPNSSPSGSPTKETSIEMSGAGADSTSVAAQNAGAPATDAPARTLCLGCANVGKILSSSPPGTPIRFALSLRVPERVKGGRVGRLRRATYDMVLEVSSSSSRRSSSSSGSSSSSSSSTQRALPLGAGSIAINHLQKTYA